MTIRTKVVGGLLLILFLVLSVSIYDYSRFRQANARLNLVNQLFLPFSRLVVQLQGNVFSLAEDMRRFYFLTDPSSENSTFSRMLRDLYPYLIHKKFTNAEELLARPEHQEVRGMVNEMNGQLVKARELFDQLVASRDKPQFERTYLQLRAHLQLLSKRVDEECQKITLAAQSEGSENLMASISLSGLVTLFAILAIVISHRVLRPLPQLITSIKKIADGDFNQGLKVSASEQDEVSVLAREYNRMLAGLVDRDRKIREQQKELLQSEKLAAIGQLSAEVVHEIRNPLNSISLNIDWLENELAGKHEDEIARTLQSISREIERLNQITESYLVRARVPITESPKTPVNELLREILDFTREEDRARNIAVSADFAKEEIFVKTDRSRLKQAFLNVLRNAREAMPRGGKLTVRTEVRENVYKIQFSDSGYGMNDSTKVNTFLPFFTTKPNGNGLGLTLTKTIVEEAQGSIQCESLMGQGTTFTMHFPA